MPPRNASFNPTSKLATTRIYPEGAYELIIGEPKVFSWTNQEKGTETYGVGYPLTIAEGDFKGERYTHNLWLHSENAGGMTKQFLMVGTGYKLDSDSETKYNEDHINDPVGFWDVDYEAKTCGEGYHALKGHRVVFYFAIGVNENTGGPSQKIKKMEPLA